MTDRSVTVSAEPSCPQCGAPVSLPKYADMAICAYCGSTLARDRVRALHEESEQELERQHLRSVKCSQCAGSLSAREGKRVLVCDHCGVRVAVLQNGGLSRWYFPARAERAQAMAAGAAWLREHEGIAGDFRGAGLFEIILAYAPIWEHRVLAAGWEFGYRRRTRVVTVPNPGAGEDGQKLELRMLEEGVQEPRLHERRFYLPATDFEVLGARRPRVSGRELLVPLLAGELEPTALVLDAEGDAADVRETGNAMARQPFTDAGDAELHVFLFRESVALLYYPLWLLRYRQGAQYGRVVVDGRDGTVNSGKAPADLRGKTAALAAKIGGSMVLAAVAVYLAVELEAGRAPFAAAAVVMMLVSVVLGLRFRPDKEVEYHDPFSC